jgi:multidrug efflux system membrane fusion protein
MDTDGQKEIDKQKQTRAPFIRRRRWKWLLIVIVLAAGIYLLYGRAEKTGVSDRAAKRPAPLLPVTAVAARIADVGVYLSGLGSVTPLSTVTVKTRVDGQLMSVLFKEGQIVRNGDLLAEVDPRPFQVQLIQAEGQMARDLSLLNNARLDLQRYQLLAEQDSIAKQQRDTQEALVRQYEGTVKTDQGQIDNAKLQLVYSRITAPAGGRVGLRLVDPGNIVHATDTNGLVVITQLQPISVVFSIPEDNLPKILARLKAGARLPVEAYDRDMKERLTTGSLLTVDNQIDPTTGTVRLKALFQNKGNELFPNQFVNARLLVDTLHNVIVVPAAAIQRGPQGTFVFIVKEDRTAGVRPVSVGETQGGESAVMKGLSAGELVVVEGAERLHEGAKVELKGQDRGAGSVGSKRRGG